VFKNYKVSRTHLCRIFGYKTYENLQHHTARATENADLLMMVAYEVLVRSINVAHQ
jgi:hypothetical protein